MNIHVLDKEEVQAIILSLENQLYQASQTMNDNDFMLCDTRSVLEKMRHYLGIINWNK